MNRNFPRSTAAREEEEEEGGFGGRCRHRGGRNRAEGSSGHRRTLCRDVRRWVGAQVAPLPALRVSVCVCPSIIIMREQKSPSSPTDRH